MGWSIQLKADKEISVDDVSKIVDILPPNLKGYAASMGCKIRQSWGWSVGVDVYNPEKNVLKLHGSYGISGNIAEEFAKFMSNGLKAQGHKIKIGKIN